MPDIAKVRNELGVPANRTAPDGSPYHTLPMIHDTSTGQIVGDSFEIACYLDSTYPNAPRLFRPNTVGLTAAFNAQVDGIFTKHVSLIDRMPFDPSVQETVNKMFADRHASSPPDPSLFTPEGRKSLWLSFEAALGELAKSYRHTGGTTDYFWSPTGTAEEQRQRGREDVGPFLDGDEPVYADFIVGAWLNMMRESMEKKNWERIRSWQGGLWGRVVDALGQWSEMK